MKKYIYFIIFLFISQLAVAQITENYSIKGEFLYGSILKHNDHLKNLVKGPATGGEVAIEWQTMGEKDWQQFFNYPKMGLGLNVINLGNPDTLGYSIALYPYLNIPMVRTKYITLSLKPGAGISYVTKTFDNFRDSVLAGKLPYKMSNAAIGSHFNVFFNVGVNIEVPVYAGVSLTADAAWNHISNGSIVQPNSGINMLNGYVGLKYAPSYKDVQISNGLIVPDISRKISVEATFSGGTRQRYYKDNRNFPIASIAVGVYKPMSNIYRMGLGIDAFYDGIYTTGLSTSFKRTYIENDEFRNKVRVGISWQNELIFGKFIAGIHTGIYVYNPLKYLEPVELSTGFPIEDMPKKGLIYPYNIEKEDGWFYTRISGKYLITNHIYAAIGLKTHLQKAEFIEWGVGCRF